MSVTHLAMIRYQALDKCFRNQYRKYFIEDLVKICCEAIYNNQGIVDGVKLRQIWKDIAFMESPEGWSAPIKHIKDGKRVYFRYSDTDFSINKQPLSQEEIAKLKETLFLLSKFKGLPQFEWMEEFLSKLEDRFCLHGQEKSVIGFDQNLDYEGLRHISTFFNAIINKNTLLVNYQKFNGETFDWIIHPYYLKQYNCRWFLFGWNSDISGVTNMPLDRIRKFSVVNDIPFIDKNINFEEFFDDIIGVTYPPEGMIEPILLKFDKERLPYILTKPIHMSMKVKDLEEGLVEINVIPNWELESLIFSYGPQVEVLSPSWLRKEIGEKVISLSNRYSH